MEAVQGRLVDLSRITSERIILQEHLEAGRALDTHVRILRRPTQINPIKQDILGVYRSPKARKAVVADMDLLSAFQKKRLPVPAFLEAGPRKRLRHNPQKVTAAIVTTGGLAPGLHCVIHSIVKRHTDIYEIDKAHGKVFGVYNSFKGLCQLADNCVELDPGRTEEWLDQGGSKLGSVRYYPVENPGPETIPCTARAVSSSLRLIDILYVIGGDNSLRVAHEIAEVNPTLTVVGIPKTMDNDILWVWQSFGFDTAVEQATYIINTMRSEAEATRRICLIELFGAESGFVAANAALASGRTDAVLIPEVFEPLDTDQAVSYLNEVVKHIEKTIQKKRERHTPHAVLVVAEGVGTVLQKMGACIDGVPIQKGSFLTQFAEMIERGVHDAHGGDMRVFENRPRHQVRAVPANAHDEIYCERLGALAVDNALAGYTDFMVSQWLTEYVLVPLRLVSGQKSVPVNGMFWKQVVSSTGQPLSPKEAETGQSGDSDTAS